MKNFLRTAIQVAVVLLLVFCAAVLVELLPGLKALDAWMQANEVVLLVTAGGAAGVGLFLLLGSVLSLLMDSGTPMDHGAIESHQRSMRDSFAQPWSQRASSYRLLGRGGGAQGHDEFSFAQLKAAFASGAVVRTPLWRRRLCAVCGGMLMFLGLFGLVIVLAPMALKLLLFAAVAYAIVRIFWGLLRA